MEEQLQRLAGVTGVKASAATRNILFHYDRRQVNEQGLLEQLRAFRPGPADGELRGAEPSAAASKAAAKNSNGKRARRRPLAVVEGTGKYRRARISVHGIHRDSGLSKKLVEKLEKSFGVTVRSNVLTGRITVEYDHTLVKIEEMLTTVGELELPPLEAEDQPSHPFSDGPLRESAVRMFGSMLGLTVITVQELFFPGAGALVFEGTAATVAAGAHLVHGAPIAHRGIRRFFGSHGARVINTGINLATLALAGLPLGLIVVGVEAGLMLKEVLARRSAFRRYEDGLDHAGSETPGRMIRLEPGMVVPAPARILEGRGSAITHSGKHVMLHPGHKAPSGGIVYGGPFLLELEGPQPFTPVHRSAPPG
jgi:hypothetical protein